MQSIRREGEEREEGDTGRWRENSWMKHSSPNTVCSFRVAGPCNLFRKSRLLRNYGLALSVGRLVNLLSLSTSISSVSWDEIFPGKIHEFG